MTGSAVTFILNSTAVDALLVMAHPRRSADMERKLKGHLLVRPQSVKQRDRRAERLEVRETDRILDPAQKPGNGGLLNMPLAGSCRAALNFLGISQRKRLPHVLQVNYA